MHLKCKKNYNICEQLAGSILDFEINVGIIVSV